MANYLQTNAQRPANIQSSGATGPGSIPDIDGAYTTEIIAEDNGKPSFTFKGYIPEDFNFDLDSNWSPNGGINQVAQEGLDRLTGGLASTAQKAAFGGALTSRQGAFQTWEGPSYLSLTLPFELVAWSSGQEDVLDPIVAMLSLAAPREQDGPSAMQDANGKGGGLMLPPGLSPVEAALGSANATGGSDDSPLKGRRMSLRIGDFFFMDKNYDPCLITNVSTAIESQFEVNTGIPISAVMNVQLVSYYPISDLAIQRMFRAGGRSGR